MKRKLLSFAVLFCCTVMGWGQVDITDQHLNNADLKINPTTNENGWVTNWITDYQTSTNPETNVNVVEFYAGWDNFDHKEFLISQEVTLPAGDYRIAVNAIFRHGDPGDRTNGGKAYIFVQGESIDEKQDVLSINSDKNGDLISFSTWNLSGGSDDLKRASNAFANGYFSNEFDFTLEKDVTIQLGFAGTFDILRCWVAFGPVKLYRYSVEAYLNEYKEAVKKAEELYEKPMAASVLTDLQKAASETDETLKTSADCKAATANLKAAIEVAKQSISNYEAILAILNATDEFGEEGQKVYKESEIIKELQKGYNERTIEALSEEQKNAAEKAFIEAQLADNQNNINMTFFITNPEINGSTGWTTEKPNDGNGPLLNNNSFEYWQGSAVNGEFNYYQTISDLPNGVYTLTAEMYNSTNGEAGATSVNGASGLYAATATAEAFAPVTTDSQTLTAYTTPEIAVTDGKLTIGVKNITNMSARWFVADNFSLLYVRGLSEEEIAAQPEKDKKAALEVATELAQTVKKKDAKATLNTAIEEDAAADELWTAINAARHSHMVYFRTYDANVNNACKYADAAYADAYTDLVMGLYNAGELEEQPLDIYHAYVLERIGTSAGTDYTPVILNAAIDEGAAFWSNPRTNTNEAYEGAPDAFYLDRNQENLNSNQVIKGMPAGDYHVKVATRATAGVDGRLYISAKLPSDADFNGDIETQAINAQGASDGELGHGWAWTEADFTLEETMDIRLGVYAGLGKNQWASVDDWHLTYVSKLSEDITITNAEYTAHVTTLDVDFTITEGLTAYIVTDKNDKYITLEEIDKVPAGTAVILGGAAGNYTLHRAEDEVGEATGNLFMPGGEQKGDGSSIFALGYKNEKVGFYLVGTDVTVPADKGYLVIPTTNEVKAFIPFGGNTTGIEEVTAKGEESSEDIIYNLAGQRVLNPTNGIYIVNGKKVLINK